MSKSLMSKYVGKRVRVVFVADMVRANLHFEHYTLLGFSDAGVFLQKNGVDVFLPYHMIAQISHNQSDDAEAAG